MTKLAWEYCRDYRRDFLAEIPGGLRHGKAKRPRTLHACAAFHVGKQPRGVL